MPVERADLDTIKAGLAAEPGSVEKERSKKSRARRLSYVDHRGETKTKVLALGDTGAEDGDTSEGEPETVSFILVRQMATRNLFRKVKR